VPEAGLATRESQFSLVSAPGRETSKKIRHLADFLADWFRHHPVPQ